jgi:hypothetical protein
MARTKGQAPIHPSLAAASHRIVLNPKTDQERETRRLANA